MIKTGTIDTKSRSANNTVRLTTNFIIRGYSYSVPKEQELYPLMELPSSLQGLYFENTSITYKPYELFPANAKVGNIPLPEVTIPLPAADKILTEYGEKYLKYRFTMEVLKFNGIKSGISQSSSESDTSGIKYSVDIMKALNKESAGTVEGSYEKQLQKTIGYYVGHQAIIFDFNTKLNALKLECIEELQKVGYKYNSKDERVSVDYATDFIARMNVYVNGKLREFMIKLQRMSASEDIKY